MKSTWMCAAFLAAVIAVAGCGGGAGSTSSSSGNSGGGPIPVVSPTGTTGPVSQAAFVCPTSDTATASVRAAFATAAQTHRLPLRTPTGTSPVTATSGLLAVSYDRALATTSQRSIAASEMRLGATFRREFDFPRIGLTTRIITVPASSIAHVEATLRAQPGVRSVGLTGGRRYPLAVTSAYFTNDPYFAGFPNPLPTGGVQPPPTYHTLPYAENADVPGQWGLHAARFDYAFAYSQQGNGSNVSSANALGSPSVKIAVIDSGADTSQLDLGSKITYQRCFITDTNGTQSTSNFVTDPDGHGTDVSGIAGAVTGNGFGFTGAGGNSTLYEYRIDPTPDSSCADTTTSQNDPQCGASVDDVASAINDAVAHGVSVINLSLGSFASDGTSSGCTNGVDQDAVEGNAVANAVANNVILVAAAGNGGSAALSSPGCDAGVIAVGASALADGQLNGAKNSNGSSVAPIEYVASYSSYGSSAAAFRNAAAWGIVAPGGDPANDTDADELHWIENLWTSTPFASSDAGTCGADYPFTTSTPTECRTLIAGTSMSTPVIAGAAALILAVSGSTYATPARMKQLLCTTTDNINDAREGCGRLNIYRAMAIALGDTVTP